MKRLSELLLAGAIIAVLFARGIVEYANEIWNATTNGNYQGVSAVDLNAILATLTQGSNPILLLIAFFLFKDQIFALFKPKPVEPTPPPVATPAPAPVPPTVDNMPVLKVLVNEVLPVLLPLLVDALKKQQEDKAK